MSVKRNILTKTDDDLQKIFFGEIIIDIELDVIFKRIQPSLEQQHFAY